jgi:hypothetical protein
VGHGERLIKDVYEVIRKSPLWERSVLIITYDEHGGFFDHVPPPRATKPGGDDTKYNQNKFDFSQYGVRVPSIVISPWITKPLISTTTYDHVTILKTVARLFPEQLGFIEHINPRLPIPRTRSVTRRLFFLTSSRRRLPSRITRSHFSDCGRVSIVNSTNGRAFHLPSL